MTIRDIAKLANVSVSTVSKALNGKDASISEETRDRIQKIAKEYHYMPYSSAIAGRSSLLLGILLGDNADLSLLTGLSLQARTRGYGTILSMYGSPEEERANMRALAAHHVDGVIWVTSPLSPPLAAFSEELGNTPVYVLDEFGRSAQGAFFSYEALGFKTAQAFIDLGHRSIVSVSSADDPRQRAFVDGIRKCLLENGVYADPHSLWALSGACNSAWLLSYTGVICMDSKSMARVAGLVERLNLRIAEDLSVVSLCPEEWTLNGTHVTRVAKPYKELGRFAADRLIDRVEQTEHGVSFVTEARLDHPDSLSEPRGEKRRHLVVVGMSNIDTLISIDHQLEPGETVNVKHRMITPGGKGLNQALAIVKLGGDAALISSLGGDLEGRMIFECLKTNGVNTEGVVMHSGASSGCAYIHVQGDAESSISVYGGANERLTASHISANEALFENAAYCLLQTELDQKIALHAAALAKKHRVKVILKPCAISQIDPELLRSVDILIPNQKEARKLLPAHPSVEEQAECFRRGGAGTVIITLGERGCYKLDEQGGVYFPPAPISPVDATGAADAFISALAVYLTKGTPLDDAIRYATCAAGLSTTRHGVPPSLVDADTLETFYAVHYEKLREQWKSETLPISEPV